jgi:hypothetical protein
LHGDGLGGAGADVALVAGHLEGCVRGFVCDWAWVIRGRWGVGVRMLS